ncbi:hypothetical protein LCGC14_1095540 [marine sediment metagenome]|uniref:Uncharacterized protein n=1 Tax=marine sediment metagenome TaxID=412755 RepID=A0A0F9QH31_9ZZZZ
MRKVFIDGFADELLKLAVADIHVDTPDPNLPWRADAEARGIKRTQSLPSTVPTGKLGDVGELSKGDSDDRSKGQEQTGEY